MEPYPHETPYEALRTSPVSSEREEGEIVDDEFEDISDNSISLPLCYGKSVSPREHLPALCLSSVSDDDDDGHSIFYEKSIKKRKKTYRKRKHRKRIISKSDSDDEEFVTLDKVLQEQLKAAIRVDNSNEEQKNNSLRTRLRGMSKNENNLEKQSNSNSEELDTELYALRSEALKTAVLNKFKYRKRKLKNLDEVSSKDSSQAEESKLENDINVIEPKNKVPCIENIEGREQNVKENDYENIKKDDDEDEDVLKALLLASMAKRMTKNTENIEVKSVEPPPPKVETMLKPGFKIASKSEKHTIFKTHPLQLPKVKPLIINLNDDSDSEDNSFIKRSDVPLKSTPTINNIVDIETAVDAFLKSQRAKVEAKELSKPEETSDKLDKSCVRLLPKNKQLEYKNLIKRLEDAKKMRLRKTTLKTNVAVKMNIKNKNRVLINKHIEVNKKGPTRDTNEDLKLLHKTLKEMQMNKDGKFQIQHKYASLLPTIKKITESSSERRKYDEQVKKMLQELNEAKKKSFAAHQNFSIHVKELLAKKEEIDRKINKNVNHIVTSTPLKRNVDSLNETATKIPISNPNKENKLNEDQVHILSGQDISSAGKCKEDGTNGTEQPNSNIPQYVSPLDTVNRIIDDPFSIMCPYDIDGNCCDPECIYNHYCEK